MAHLRFLTTSILAGVLAPLALPGPAPARPPARPAAVYRVDGTLTVTGQGLHQRLRLKVLVNGAAAYDQPVTSRSCVPGCRMADVGTAHTPIRVIALKANAIPNVVIGLFSGGAHCCFIDQVFTLDPATLRFSKTEHDFLDAGARLVDLQNNRNYEFLSADARLSNAGFTDYADSPAPVQIWSFSRNRFLDITRRYPSQIAPEAARLLRAFGRQHGNGRGLIAAWAADEDLLGHPRVVASELAGALTHGRLGTPETLGGPSPVKFVAQLQKLLRRLRYAS